MPGWKTQLQIGALLMLLAVLLGAFGAHALKGVLDSYGVSLWQKASLYHFVHGMAVLIVGILCRSFSTAGKCLSASALVFIAGIILFSGSLYLYAILRIGWLMILTPIGGSLFIVGWAMLAWSVKRLPD